MVAILPRIRSVFNRPFRFKQGREIHTFRFPKLPNGQRIQFIVPITNTRIKNIKLALGRRIRELGYDDRVGVMTRSRKIILCRI